MVGGADAQPPIAAHLLHRCVEITHERFDGVHAVVTSNDQHAHIEVPESSPLRVGDRLCFGISHPCTTFDRWQLIYEVDKEMNVLAGIRTYF